MATTTPVRTDTNAENEQPEKNQISVKKSRVFTFVEKTGLGHQHGVEGRLKSGSIQLGAGQDAGTLVFDMASFDADTDAARNYLGLEGSTSATTREQVNSNMRSTPILHVREFPTATFVIQSAKLISDQDATGKSRYELSGDFTLRGKTRPIKFMAEVQQKDGMNHVTGKFSILQTQYGITPFKKALGAVGIADRLTIHGDLWLAM
ncbi:MAG: YceI family protein [Planctomycetaceae bacterium]